MTVSVIIPCYNSADTLQQCVDSVLQQSRAVLEVICIDDGSQDATPSILLRLADAHSLIVHIRQDNAGATAARNKGLSIAKGDYIQFLDADDYLLPQKIERQLVTLANHPETDILVGSYRRRDESGLILGEKVYAELKQDPWWHLIHTDLGCTCSNLFRRAKVQSAGAWDPSLKSSQEYDLMFRMLTAGAKVSPAGADIDTEVLVRTSGSISAMDKAGNWERYIALRVRMRDFLSAHTPALVPIANQQLFDACRLLYAYSPGKAKDLIQAHIPKGFSPKVSTVTSPFYLKLYRLLGLTGAEKVRKILGR
jgi:glycosyltransferase involved in cell wall biosynthesis